MWAMQVIFILYFSKKFNSVKTFNQHIETKKHDPKINKTN